MAVCPICKRRFEPAQSEHPVFCSTRCQQVDLGRWLREDYSFPSGREPEESEYDDEEPPPVDATTLF